MRKPPRQAARAFLIVATMLMVRLGRLTIVRAKRGFNLKIKRFSRRVDFLRRKAQQSRRQQGNHKPAANQRGEFGALFEQPEPHGILHIPRKSHRSTGVSVAPSRQYAFFGFDGNKSTDRSAASRDSPDGFGSQIARPKYRRHPRANKPQTPASRTDRPGLARPAAQSPRRKAMPGQPSALKLYSG